MNITITITNPSANVLAALAQARDNDTTELKASLDKIISALAPEDEPATPVQDAPIITPQADPQDTALRIASVADIDNYLDVGSEVHWHGAKFVFDGVVERISDDVTDTDGDLQYDTKAIFIRRNDTDKLVSLTLRDLQTGRLTLID